MLASAWATGRSAHVDRSGYENTRYYDTIR